MSPSHSLILRFKWTTTSSDRYRNEIALLSKTGTPNVQNISLINPPFPRKNISSQVLINETKRQTTHNTLKALCFIITFKNMLKYARIAESVLAVFRCKKMEAFFSKARFTPLWEMFIIFFIIDPSNLKK